MPSSDNFQIKPIGFVQTKAVGKEVRNKNVISKIIINQKYSEALKGIEEFSHIFILFWLNKVSKKDTNKMKVHPRGRIDMPLLGIFATRTPHRPNPIGLTRVKILKIEGNTIIVGEISPGTTIVELLLNAPNKPQTKTYTIDLTYQGIQQPISKTIQITVRGG